MSNEHIKVLMDLQHDARAVQKDWKPMAYHMIATRLAALPDVREIVASTAPASSALVDVVRRVFPDTLGFSGGQTRIPYCDVKDVWEALEAEKARQPESPRRASRWVRLAKVSNSGNMLYVCTVCGRESKTPGQTCGPHPKDAFGRVIDCVAIEKARCAAIEKARQPDDRDAEIARLRKERDDRAEQVDIQQQLIDTVIVACGSVGLMESELPKHVGSLRQRAEAAEARAKNLRGSLDRVHGVCDEAGIDHAILAKHAAREPQEAEHGWRHSMEFLLRMIAMVPESKLPEMGIDPYGTISGALRCLGVSPKPDAWRALHRWAHGYDPGEYEEPQDPAPPADREGDDVLRAVLGLPVPEADPDDSPEYLASVLAIRELCRRALEGGRS